MKAFLKKYGLVLITALVVIALAVLLVITGKGADEASLVMPSFSSSVTEKTEETTPITTASATASTTPVQTTITTTVTSAPETTTTVISSSVSETKTITSVETTTTSVTTTTTTTETTPLQTTIPVVYDGQCTLTISYKNILLNMDKLKESKKQYVNPDGIVLENRIAGFSNGDSVFDVLKRVCREDGIQLEFSASYIEGIANLYEFDCGFLSGWMYKVNGELPNVACSEIKLKDGDKVEFIYTCNMGDV